MQSQPTNATQAKDRHYMQLSHSLTRLSQSIGHTAELCASLTLNLDAMRTLAASHAAQFMTVAAELNADPEGTDGELPHGTPQGESQCIYPHATIAVPPPPLFAHRSSYQ
ncbi:hypothetical protein BKA93DRAFT_825765 [Sparassis latifolia]|uniref:Uncharacterized protein n=1 Tax=Sparassis crispa TaxID=139825 RepID=A0A401GWI6_9APHY|nr:hypothetical protein SCP_0904660 [Sparassis crispa]GBE86587.1 hypothetical protein SCP_0904660 [Sparassis crispa]